MPGPLRSRYRAGHMCGFADREPMPDSRRARHRRRPAGQGLQDHAARWTASRSRSRRARSPGLLGGNGAGKTTTIAMIMGLVDADLGHACRCSGAEMPRQRYQVLHRMNFESPYVDMPHAADGAAEPHGVRPALRACEDLDERIARARARISTSTEFLDRPAGKLSAGQKTRVALAKALINSARGAAARRADRLARSRHRRLGARPARALPQRARRHRPARLPQHGRGRAAVRARHHHEARRASRTTTRPQRLLARYGRETLEEVFLDVARGRGEARGGGAMTIGAPSSARRVRAVDRVLAAAASVAMVLRYLVSAALVLAAAARADLLAGGADVRCGASCSSTSRRIPASSPRAGGIFIGAVLLWDILFRGQLGFSISFLEEMWSRNLGNLMISPLRPIEFVCALMIMSLDPARDRHGAGHVAGASPSSASTSTASASRWRRSS